ncbi:MAG: hypothetical protein ACI9FJ_001666 [Alteromonadaceae bacterium]
MISNSPDQQQYGVETGFLVNKKIVIYMLASVLGYILFAGSIMLFYKDNPERMDLTERQEFNLKYLETLSLHDNTPQNAVIDYLGSPDITEAKAVKDKVYQVMFYRTRKITGDGITTKDECTPILFIDGVLIAWGDNAYNQYQSY